MGLAKEKQRIQEISDLLYKASRPLRVLSHISWDPSVREAFFAKDARELPKVSYPAYDPGTTLEIVSMVSARLQSGNPIDDWLLSIATDLENTSKLLQSCGTKDFYHYSTKLFGTPTTPILDENTSSLGLARQLTDLFSSFDSIDLGAPDSADITADMVAERMREAVGSMFGEEAPEIIVVDELSANALAGSARVRIRRAARFSDKDIKQLIHHEAYIHVATSLNGQNQPNLKILAASHPGTTKTQEGLAVFAEFITGSMDLDRMHRLADRVITIQMAIEGADFLDVYKYYLERIGHPGQSFENTRRVFRGGTLTGGAPFTKDIVYLDGLLHVDNFLRSIVVSKRTDLLRMLFCGKLDIDDIPVLSELARMGLCQPAKYLPPWATDMRFLLAYLTYSSFLNKTDLSRMDTHYNRLLNNVPIIDFDE